MYNERTSVFVDGTIKAINTRHLLYQIPWDYKLTSPIVRITNRSGDIISVKVDHVSNVGVLPVPSNYLLNGYQVQPYSYYDLKCVTLNAQTCIYVQSDMVNVDFDMLGNLQQLYGVDIFGSGYSSFPSGSGVGYSGTSGWSGYSGYSGVFDPSSSVDGGYF